MGAPNGHKFTRTIDTAERDAEIARYCIGRTGDDAAKHFGLTKGTISRARRRAIDAAVVPAGQAALAAELLKIAALEDAAWAILRANHVVVSDGRVVLDPETSDRLVDPRPVLMAIDRVLRCSERRSKLLGIDAPTRAEVRVTDDLTAEIAELAAQLGAADRSPADRSEEGAAGPAQS